MDLHATCLVNCCQGKDARVLFGLNYSIHRHTGIGCDTNSREKELFLILLGRHNSLHIYCHYLSLFLGRRVDDWIAKHI